MMAKQSGKRKLGLTGFALVFMLAFVLSLGVGFAGNGGVASAAGVSLPEHSIPIGGNVVTRTWNFNNSQYSEFRFDASGGDIKKTSKNGELKIDVRNVAENQAVQIYGYVPLPEDFSVLNIPLTVSLKYDFTNPVYTKGVEASLLAMQSVPVSESQVSMTNAVKQFSSVAANNLTVGNYSFSGSNRYLRIGFTCQASKKIDGIAYPVDDMEFTIRNVRLTISFLNDNEGPLITSAFADEANPPVPSSATADGFYNSLYNASEKNGNVGKVLCDVYNPLVDDVVHNKYVSYIPNASDETNKTVKFIVWDRFVGVKSVEFGGLELPVNADGTPNESTIETCDTWKDGVISGKLNLNGIEKITTQAFGYKTATATGPYRGVKVTVVYNGKYISKIVKGEDVYGGIYKYVLNGKEYTRDFFGVKAESLANGFLQYKIGERYEFNSTTSDFRYIKNGVTKEGTYTNEGDYFVLRFADNTYNSFNASGYMPEVGAEWTTYVVDEEKLYRVNTANSSFEYEIGGITSAGTVTEIPFTDMLPQNYQISTSDLTDIKSTWSKATVTLGGIDRNVPDAASAVMDSAGLGENDWYVSENVTFAAKIAAGDPMKNVSYFYTLYRGDSPSDESVVVVENEEINPTVNGKKYTLSGLVSGYYTLKIRTEDAGGNTAENITKFKVDVESVIENAVGSVTVNGAQYNGECVKTPIVVALEEFSAKSGVVYEYRKFGDVWQPLDGVVGYNAVDRTFTFDSTISDHIETTYQFRIRTNAGVVVFGKKDNVKISYDNREPGGAYSVWLDAFTESNPYRGFEDLKDIIFDISGDNSAAVSYVEYQIEDENGNIIVPVRRVDTPVTGCNAVKGDFSFYGGRGKPGDADYEPHAPYVRKKEKRVVRMWAHYAAADAKETTTEIWLDAPRMYIEFVVNGQERFFDNTTATTNDVSYVLYGQSASSEIKRQIISAATGMEITLGFGAGDLVYINDKAVVLSQSMTNEFFEYLSADVSSVTVKAKKQLNNVTVSNFARLNGGKGNLLKEEFVTLKKGEFVTINYNKGESVYIGEVLVTILNKDMLVQNPDFEWSADDAANNTVTLKAKRDVENLRIANFKVNLHTEFDDKNAAENRPISLKPLDDGFGKYITIAGAGEENLVVGLITKNDGANTFSVNYDVDSAGAIIGYKSISKAKLVVMAQKTVGQLTAVSAPEKEYDGNTDVTFPAEFIRDGKVVLNDLYFVCPTYVAGEPWKAFTFSADFVFADKNVNRAADGTVIEREVIVANIAFAGADYTADNYVVVYRTADGEFVEITSAAPTATAYAKINPRKLTVNYGNLHPLDKTYDGTPYADLSTESTVELIGVIPENGVVAGDEVAISLDGNVYFAKYDETNGRWVRDANAGNKKTVVIKFTELSGAQAGNYSIAESEKRLEGDDGAAILKRDLTIESIVADSKEYDGSAAVAQPENLSVKIRFELSGAVVKDKIAFTITDAVFGDGDLTAFTPSGEIGWHDVKITYAIESKAGVSLDNYSIRYNGAEIPTSGDILASQKSAVERHALTVDVQAGDKVYDGTTAVVGGDPTITITGLDGAYIGEVSADGNVTIAGKTDKVNIPYIYFASKDVYQKLDGSIGSVKVIFVLGKFENIPYDASNPDHAKQSRFRIDGGINENGIPNVCVYGTDVFGKDLNTAVVPSATGDYVLVLPVYDDTGVDVSKNYAVPWYAEYSGAKITKRAATATVTGINESNVNPETGAYEIIFGNYYKDENGELVRRANNAPVVDYGVLDADKVGFAPEIIEFSYNAPLGKTTAAKDGYEISIKSISSRNYEFTNCVSLKVNVVKKDITVIVENGECNYQETIGDFFENLKFVGLEGNDTVNKLVGRYTDARPSFRLLNSDGTEASTFPTVSTLQIGTYDIEVTFVKALENYNFSVSGADYEISSDGLVIVKKQAFTVKKIPRTDVEFDKYITFVYDGKEKAVFVSEKTAEKLQSEGATITYRVYDRFNPDDEIDGNVCAEYTQNDKGNAVGVKDVGRYRVVVTIVSDDYADYIGRSEIVISKAEVRLTLANKNITAVYDGKAHPYYKLSEDGILSISSDLVAKSDVELEYANENTFEADTIIKSIPKEKGVYYVRAKYKGADKNIKCKPSAARTIRINAIDIPITVTSPRNYVYEECFSEEDFTAIIDETTGEEIYKAITFSVPEEYQQYAEFLCVEYTGLDETGVVVTTTDAPTTAGEYKFAVRVKEGTPHPERYNVTAECKGTMNIANQKITVYDDEYNSEATIKTVNGTLPQITGSYSIVLQNMVYGAKSDEAKAFNVALGNNVGILRGVYKIKQLYLTQLVKQFDSGDAEVTNVDGKIKVFYRSNKLGKNQKLVRIDIINAETGATNIVVMEPDYKDGMLSFTTDRLGYFAVINMTSSSLDDSVVMIIVLSSFIGCMFVITLIIAVVSGKKKKRFQKYLEAANASYNATYGSAAQNDDADGDVYDDGQTDDAYISDSYDNTDDYHEE